jgi:hypothetical protein
LVLRDYQAVTGVQLNGGGDLTKALTFRIAGTKAAKGTLRLTSRGLSGRVGGKRVALRLSTAQATALHDGLRVAPLSALAH